MDFKKHFERAWQVMMEHFAPVLVNTLVMIAVSVISLGFLAPVVSAGYMQSLLLALRRNRRPDVKDLFARMDLFFPLLGFTILFVLLVMLGPLLQRAIVPSATTAQPHRPPGTSLCGFSTGR